MADIQRDTATATAGTDADAGVVAGVVHCDALVVGAGFAGMYQLQRLREAGFNTVVLDKAGDVGGTWYWNRYPGARCDILSVDYSYSWDPDLQNTWQWSERYATQPEILRYAQHVADKHDLRRDIRFNTQVDAARWNETNKVWEVTTLTGERYIARYYIMATGCLSVPKVPDVAGADQFTGETYYTGTWPHEGVDFTGKRVAVIGTGSSGMQAIPLIAKEATALTVFQRTPNFSIPAHNGPIAEERIAPFKENPATYRETARWSQIGVPSDVPTIGAFQASAAERLECYETLWQQGELKGLFNSYTDMLSDPAANDSLRQFIHTKIRSMVDDQAVAEKLCPTSFYVGTKRLCLDTQYHATFNHPHVSLVDLNEDPITTITSNGIETKSGHQDYDAIVFATGFDAMTGAVVSVNIEGKDGVSLRKAWEAGPETYLGLMSVGFPNLFMITGPGSPSVLSNMMVSIEQHVDWVSDTLIHLRDSKIWALEPTELAQRRWVQHNNEFADLTLMPSANSWYMGANVPGKPQVFLPYIGGVGRYRRTCNEVIERGYLGFAMEGEAGLAVNDGIIRELKPDVQVLLETIEELGLPPIEDMGFEGAREFLIASGDMLPAGPEVGQVLDASMPAADGSAMTYRLYRPASEGPHPVVVYFHGGGWVLGNHGSDDPLCRDLCLQSDCILLSVGYRHAPEHRFPAAAEDAIAAVQWVSEHMQELGGIPGEIAVAGWSAGGNIATVAAQQLRDTGPKIMGQLLLCPATDCDFDRPSHRENGENLGLTTSLMHWFWDTYCDAQDRKSPMASPLRAESLANMPPTMVVTAQFDPLRDEGDAYAQALVDAGTNVQHICVDGHTHTSIPAVGAIVTADSVRTAMADALRGFFTEK